MKTIDDLEEVEQNKLTSLIESIDETKYNYSKSPNKAYGLCSTCKFCKIAESEFEIMSAICSVFRCNLQTTKPIRNCTEYEERGILNLWEMKDIAILIDIPKTKAGFLES